MVPPSLVASADDWISQLSRNTRLPTDGDPARASNARITDNDNKQKRRELICKKS
jgi:hypothetical protein